MVESKLVKLAIEDERTRDSIKSALPHFVEGRKKAFADVDFEEWRERASSIREETLKNLDFYLEELKAKIEECGGKVLFAKDKDEANEIIGGIARRFGAKLIVKSKSMITEEIELNAYLERSGFRVVETDLGEFIIQLARERPSHIIAPAVHKRREDVKELFEKSLNEKGGDSIEELALIARRVLREKFLEADMGITGVNFAVSQTGTIVIVENEGNVRMVTSLPKVHVALMSLEKVLPKFEHLALFLPLLTRSATGQLLTSYINFITGVEEGKKFYLVILDNGRREILRDDKFYEILKCIRCGACINHCPVYRNLGGHAYGWVYPGPMGAVLTPLLLGIERWGHLAYYSTLCNKCYEVCPVKINIPSLLVELRRRLVEVKRAEASPGIIERIMIKIWGGVMRDSEIYRRFVHFFSGILRPMTGRGWIKWIPLFAWTRSRWFPSPRKRMFRDYWRHRK